MDITKERISKREKELKLYEKKFNLFKKPISLSENKDMSKILHPKNNYKMDEYLKSFIVKNYSSNNDYKVLKYELEDFNFDNYKINNLSDLKNNIKYLLNRYSFIVKDILEDKWLLYDNNISQNKYELENNQFTFDNSISINKKNDDDLVFYIKNMMSICKKLASKVNYKMYTKFYDDEYYDICWLMFIFTEKNKN